MIERSAEFIRNVGGMYFTSCTKTAILCIECLYTAIVVSNNGWLLVVLRLNVPVNNFQSCRDGAIASWVINQYFRGVKCLAQGHNTAAVGLEPRTSRSGVRHSTTEPPRSPVYLIMKRVNTKV